MQKLQSWFDTAAGWSSREAHLAWAAFFLVFGGYVASIADQPGEWVVVGLNAAAVVGRLALAAGAPAGLRSSD